VSVCRRFGRLAGRDALQRDPPQVDPIVTCGAAPPTVVALRRVRRRTYNEHAKMNQVKIIKAPQHRERVVLRNARGNAAQTCDTGSRGSASLPKSLDPLLAQIIFSAALCQRCRHQLITLAKILFRPHFS